VLLVPNRGFGYHLHQIFNAGTKISPVNLLSLPQLSDRASIRFNRTGIGFNDFFSPGKAIAGLVLLLSSLG